MIVFEVGARDGLQNEHKEVTLDQKVKLVKGLLAAGVKHMELGAFVRPDRVPKMADSDLVFQALKNEKSASFYALVPNEKGLERAIAAGVKNIAVFTAASEGFAKANIGMSVAESLEEFGRVIKQAKKNKMRVRGYVSTAFGCPFDGAVKPKAALSVTEALLDLGVYEVSIGDTIGVAHPKAVEAVIKPALKNFGRRRIAGHFHDTRGTALANALKAIELGCPTIDASAGGLGGCPFAPGATGNLATEDLVYMLDGMGIKAGIDLDRLCEVSLAFHREIGRGLTSRYLQAYASQQSKKP